MTLFLCSRSCFQIADFQTLPGVSSAPGQSPWQPSAPPCSSLSLSPSLTLGLGDHPRTRCCLRSLQRLCVSRSSGSSPKCFPLGHLGGFGVLSSLYVHTQEYPCPGSALLPAVFMGLFALAVMEQKEYTLGNPPGGVCQTLAVSERTRGCPCEGLGSPLDASFCKPLGPSSLGEPWLAAAEDWTSPTEQCWVTPAPSCVSKGGQWRAVRLQGRS